MKKTHENQLPRLPNKCRTSDLLPAPDNRTSSGLRPDQNPKNQLSGPRRTNGWTIGLPSDLTKSVVERSIGCLGFVRGPITSLDSAATLKTMSFGSNKKPNPTKPTLNTHKSSLVIYYKKSKMSTCPLHNDDGQDNSCVTHNIHTQP